MITVSLCMIVKNEEDVLARCLSGVKDLVDEIIIVDTGSDDRTKEIAGRFTKNILDFQWNDDFSAARNYAFSKASMDFCMWLDGDDVIEEEEGLKFLEQKKALTLDTDIVMMRYNTAFDEDNIPTFWYYRERLIKNNREHVWQGAVHEAITPYGNVEYWDVSVSHKKLRAGDPDRNLNIYKKMAAQGRPMGAREYYYYGRELYYHQLYNEALEEFGKFMTCKDAWLENKIEACSMMASCYMALGKKEEALEILLKSLEYDIPRAELCCDIGKYFLESGQYKIAVFWYETALSCKINERKEGFILQDCYNYIPAVQLCICYDKLGRYKKAEEYNDLAGTFKPKSPAYLYNKAYFDQKI